MTPVEAHLRRIDVSVQRLAMDVVASVEYVADDVVKYLTRSLELEDGFIVRNAANASALRGLPDLYSMAVSKSTFRDETMAFVGKLSDQIDEVRSQWPSGIPQLYISHPDAEMLSVMAESALGALDTPTIKVRSVLHATAWMGYGSPLETLVNNVRDSVRKTASLGTIPRDVTMTFFRTASALGFRNAEESGTRLLYEYVGPNEASRREFCLSLMGQRMTREQMSNVMGSAIGAFGGGGGFGCSHYWMAVGRA